MNLDILTKLVKRNCERIILVENGEPSVVLMSFSDYQKSMDNCCSDKKWQKPEVQSQQELPAKPVLIPEIKQPNFLAESKAPVNPEQSASLKNELTLEDLPF